MDSQRLQCARSPQVSVVHRDVNANLRIGLHFNNHNTSNFNSNSDLSKGRKVGAVEGVKAVGAHLDRPVAPKQLVVEVNHNLMVV